MYMMHYFGGVIAKIGMVRFQSTSILRYIGELQPSWEKHTLISPHKKNNMTMEKKKQHFEDVPHISKMVMFHCYVSIRRGTLIHFPNSKWHIFESSPAPGAPETYSTAARFVWTSSN